MTDCHKMTIAVPKDVHWEFKAACARSGTSISREISKFIETRTKELNGEVSLPSPDVVIRSFGAIKEIRDLLDREVDRMVEYESKAREELLGGSELE